MLLAKETPKSEGERNLLQINHVKEPSLLFSAVVIIFMTTVYAMYDSTKPVRSKDRVHEVKLPMCHDQTHEEDEIMTEEKEIAFLFSTFLSRERL